MNTCRIVLCTDYAALDQPSFAKSVRSADAVVLPELFDGGYEALSHGTQPHHSRDPVVIRMRELSRVHSSTFVAGSLRFRRRASQPPTNTSLVFRRGRCIASYDKIHLFEPTGDHLWFRPGHRPRTFPVPVMKTVVRAGVIICYDLRFPELARVLAMRGMKLLFVPARWPAAREAAWQALLKARAIENQVFVVGCNANDAEGGASYVYDPTGELVFSSTGTARKQLHTVTLNLTALAKARRLHDNIRDAAFLRRMAIPT